MQPPDGVSTASFKPAPNNGTFTATIPAYVPTDGRGVIQGRNSTSIPIPTTIAIGNTAPQGNSTRPQTGSLPKVNANTFAPPALRRGNSDESTSTGTPSGTSSVSTPNSGTSSTNGPPAPVRTLSRPQLGAYANAGSTSTAGPKASSAHNSWDSLEGAVVTPQQSAGFVFSQPAALPPK